MKLIITGATGNVGKAIIKSNLIAKENLYACTRNSTKPLTGDVDKEIKLLQFNFDKVEDFIIPDDADAIFLMRPPQISNPDVFDELLSMLAKKKLLVIFLSIQNAEHQEYTPHRKIEHKIINSGLDFIFIRPSYFMDNLTTTLLPELLEHNRIYLPSDHIKFNWIDTLDIGEIIATAFNNKQKYINTALEITGTESFDFYQTIDIINTELNTHFSFSNPTLISYLVYQIKKATPITYILVMILLHWLPKFRKQPSTTTTFMDIMNKPPRKLREFVEKNKVLLSKQE